MPNLKNLHVDSISTSISFKNGSSLQSISLMLEDGETMEGAADMIKFLASSSKLRRLSLTLDACKILANNSVSRIRPTIFKQMKFLNLSWICINHMDEFLCAFGMIRSCPNFEELKISQRVLPSDPNRQELKISGDVETKDEPEYTLNHLRSIYIRNIRGLALEMKLISYLLAVSPSLERLSFTCYHTLKAHMELELHRQMLRFRRASPKAEVLYVK